MCIHLCITNIEDLGLVSLRYFRLVCDVKPVYILHFDWFNEIINV